MPVGFGDFSQVQPFSLEADRLRRQQAALEKRKTLRLPPSTATAYGKQLLKLGEMGMVSSDVLESAKYTGLYSEETLSSGKIYTGQSGIFNEGMILEDPDLRGQLRKLRNKTLDPREAVTSYIPKEETEPGGFWYLLEHLAVFNYAISGAANAVVNMMQGETEEANPWEEFWDGFTMRDKETFMDVYENMGWTGEGKLSYWSRWTLGLAADIVFDPLNFVTLGASSAGATILKVGTKSVKFRRGAISLPGLGRKIKPTKALDEVADNMTKRALDVLKKGNVEDINLATATPTQRLAHVLKETYEGARAETDELIRKSGTEALEEGIEETLLKKHMSKNVHEAIGVLFRDHHPDKLNKMLRESDGSLRNFFAELHDGEWTAMVAEEIMKLEGRAPVASELLDWMIDGKRAWLDPGGFKVKVPFMDAEARFKADWMDVLRFKIKNGAGEMFKSTGKALGNTFNPSEAGAFGAIGRVGQKFGKGAQSFMQGTLELGGKVKQLFGADRRKSPILHGLLIERAAGLHLAMGDSLDEAKGVLRYKDPKGKIVEKIDGKDVRFSPIDDQMQKAIYKAINLEHQSSIEHIRGGSQYFARKRAEKKLERLLEDGMEADAAELQAKLERGEVLDYEETHISSIVNDPLLEGYTQAQKEAARDVAGAIEKRFRDLYDDMADEGLEMAFLDFYLPLQYENVEKFQKIRFKSEAFTKVSDEDPFTKTRMMSEEEARKQGLKPVEDLGRLLYGRIYAAHRAQIERQFAEKFIHHFAIHSGQLDDALGGVFGPNGLLGSNILRGVRGSLPLKDLVTAKGVREIIPHLDELTDLVQTGRLDEAVEWLKKPHRGGTNRDLIGQAMIYKADAGQVGPNLFTYLDEDIHENLSKIAQHLEGTTAKYTTMAVEAGKRVDGKMGGFLDLEGAASLANATERRVAELLGVDPEKRVNVTDMVKKSGIPSVPKTLGAAENSTTDAVHLAILDEMLRGVDGARELTPELAEEVDQVAREIVELITDVGDDAAKGKSVRYAGFDEQEALLMGRFFWAEAVENQILRQADFSVPHLHTERLRHYSRIVQDLRAAGETAAANKMADKAYKELGQHEMFGRIERDWRQQNDLADIPFERLTGDVRVAIIGDAEQQIEGLLGASKRRGKEHGVNFFKQSMYKYPTKKGEASKAAFVKKVKSAIGKISGGDNVISAQLRDIAFQRAGSVAGFHYTPQAGIKGVLQSAYGARASNFLDSFRDAARESAPQKIVDAVLELKLDRDALVRDTLRAPGQVTVLVEKMISLNNQAVGAALETLAKKSGANTYLARTSAQTLSDNLDEAFTMRHGTDLSAANGAIEKAFSEFEEVVGRVALGGMLGTTLRETVAEFADHVVNLQTRVGKMKDEIAEVTSAFEAVLRSPTSLYAPADIEDILTKLDQVTNNVRQVIENVGDEATRLIAPIKPGLDLGEENVRHLFADDPIVGSYLNILNDLTRDWGRVTPATERKLMGELKKKAELHLNQAERSAEHLDGKVQKIHDEDLLAPREALRLVHAVGDDLVGRATTRVQGILRGILGDVDWLELDFQAIKNQVAHSSGWQSVKQADVLQSYFGLVLADEFLRGKNLTEEGWAKVVENVAVRGPSNKALKAFWGKNISRKLDRREVRDLFRRFANIIAEGRHTRSPRAPSAAAWALENRIPYREQPAGHEAIARAAVNTWTKHSDELKKLLDPSDTLEEDILKAYAEIQGRRSKAADSFARMSQDAFLLPEDIELFSAAMRDEGAMISAVEQVLKQRAIAAGGVEVQAEVHRLGRKIYKRGRARGELAEDKALRKSKDVISDIMQGKEDHRKLVALTGMTDTDAKRLVDKLHAKGGAARKARDFIDEFTVQRDQLYAKAMDELGEGLPINENSILNWGRDVSEEELQGVLTLMRNLEPALVEDYLNRVPGLGQPSVHVILQGIGREIVKKGNKVGHKRLRYWFSRMGYGDMLQGQGGLPSNIRLPLMEEMARIMKSGGINNAMEGAGQKVQKMAARVIQKNEGIISAHAVAKKELELFRRFVPQIEDSQFMDLQFASGKIDGFRSAIHLRNYLSLQALRAEDLAMRELLKAMPSRSERLIMSVKAQRVALEGEVGAAKRLGGAELEGGGGVLTREQISETEALGVIQWEQIEEALPQLISGPGRKVFERLGIDIMDYPTEQLLLETLFERGLEGITSIEKLDGSISYKVSGIITHEGEWLADELDSSVHELLDYLKLNRQTSVYDEAGNEVAKEAAPILLNNAPATEIQLRGIKRILDRTVEDTELHSTVIHALSSTHRMDRLTVREAAYVIENLEQYLSPKFGKEGDKLTKVAPVDREKLFIAQQSKGLVDEKLARLADGGKKKIIEEAADVGTDYEMVGLNFPSMQRVRDSFGREVDMTKVKTTVWAKRVLEQEVFRDGFFDNPVINRMLKGVVDPLTNSFKTLQTLYWPSFHVRNAVDATVRAFFAIGVKAFSIKRNREMWRLVRGKSGSVRVGDKMIPNEVIRTWLERQGLSVDFGQKIGIVQGGVSLEDFHPLSSNYVFRKLRGANEGIRNIAGAVDNTMRASLFLEGLEQGMPPAVAGRWTQKFMFDYAYGLTAFERDVMRRTFPFYTFSRFNIPLALETMMKRPGMVSALGKTQYMLSNDRDADIEKVLPSYVREQWRFRSEVKGGQLRTFSGSNIVSLEDLSFLGDLARWRSSSLKEGFFKEVIGRLNPLIKVPVELAVGRNFYLDTQISEDQTVRRALLDWPVLREYLDMRRVVLGEGPDQRTFWRVNGSRYHVLMQTHFSRLYRALTTMFGDDDQAAWERYLPLITGIRVTSVDLQRRHDHLVAVSNFNRHKITRALRQGDLSAAQRILGITERDEPERDDVSEAFSRLQQLGAAGQ